MGEGPVAAETAGVSGDGMPVSGPDRVFKARGVLEQPVDISLDSLDVVLADGSGRMEFLQAKGRAVRRPEIVRAAQAAGLGKRALREHLRAVPMFVLVGPPGTGKTRAALELLGELCGDQAIRVLDRASYAGARRRTVPVAYASEVSAGRNLRQVGHPELAVPVEFDPDDYLRGTDGLPHAMCRLTLLPAPCLGDQSMWEPQIDRRKQVRSAQAAGSLFVNTFWLLRRMSPDDVVREFLQRLIGLGRQADPARFARTLALLLRVGRLWAAFRPPGPPGQLVMASGHVTRGPNGARMTQVPVVRGEPLALM